MSMNSHHNENLLCIKSYSAYMFFKSSPLAGLSVMHVGFQKEGHSTIDNIGGNCSLHFENAVAFDTKCISK